MADVWKKKVRERPIIKANDSLTLYEFSHDLRNCIYIFRNTRMEGEINYQHRLLQLVEKSPV